MRESLVWRPAKGLQENPPLAHVATDSNNSGNAVLPANQTPFVHNWLKILTEKVICEVVADNNANSRKRFNFQEAC